MGAIGLDILSVEPESVFSSHTPRVVSLPGLLVRFLIHRPVVDR